MEQVMAAPRKPQDHLAAAKAEAKDEPVEVSFEFDGDTYTIDSDAADDLELMEHIEDEKYILALRGYLGREQWARFKDSQRNGDGRVTAAKAGEFLQALTDAIGTGNS